MTGDEKMKILKNEVLRGRKDVELTVPDETGKSSTVSVRELIKLVALNGIPNDQINLSNMRKVNDILNQLEKEDDENSETVQLENDWWEFLKPNIEKFVVSGYRVHAPFVMDILNDVKSKEDIKKAK